MPPDKQWFDYSELSAFLELDERLVREYVDAGLLPRPIQLGKRRKAWHKDDLPIIVWLIRHHDRFEPKIAREEGKKGPS